MRIESLCKLTMQYQFGSWQSPYGTGSTGHSQEGRGFGNGDGTVAGEIEGEISWANAPRRRQDGVWTPDLRGVITTKDGAELLVSLHGQSVEETVGEGARRAILARVEISTEAKDYRWLNTTFMVGEGEIDEDADNWWLDVYVCINEVAKGPPAIGAEPPDRFAFRAPAKT